jgi:hypothetical protein
MELLLALAAVIVAAASLVLAGAFNRRFGEYGRQLAIARDNQDAVEQNADRLWREQEEKTKEALTGYRTIEQRTRLLEETQRTLVRRYDGDSQARAEESGKAQQQAAGLARRMGEIGDLVTRTVTGHGSRLDALDHLAADLRARDDRRAGLGAEIAVQAATLRELRDDLASGTGHTTRALTGVRQELLALAREAERLELDHADTRAQLRHWLAHSARLTTSDLSALIMPGLVAAERPAAAEILPGLYEALLRAAGLDPVFLEQSRHSVLYYLAWHRANGQSAGQYLGGLLAGCQDDEASLAGLTEFRSLLLALHAGGPGAVRLGPLLVSHTAEGACRGIVLTAEEATALDQDGPFGPPARWADRLTDADGDRVVDLAGWAARA